MKVIIDIPEELKQKIDEGFTNQVIINKLWDATKNGTPIPDNATNGDIIKALFLCLEKYEYGEPYTHGIALAGNDNRVTWFTNEWWNAKYKVKSEDKE